MPTPDWWLSLMTTTVMWSLLTWWWPLQWSQYDAARFMLMSWWWSHEDLDDVVEPMMLAQWWLMVIVEMEPLCWWCSPWRWWSHVGCHDDAWSAWWWSSCIWWPWWWWPWGHDGDDMMMMICFAWALMTWYIHVMSFGHDGMTYMMWHVMPCLLMRIPYLTLPCASPICWRYSSFGRYSRRDYLV